MKDIVIIANFCDYETINGNNRFNYIANMLYKQGNKVELITSSFSHRRKVQRNRKQDKSYKIILINEPGYKKNISLKRFYSHYKWGSNIMSYLKKRKKPDVVYCAVPSLTGPYNVSKYCNKNNIKFIIDIQDLWPEAFQMVFNIPVISSIFFFPFKMLANRIYSNANTIFGVSESYVRRGIEKNKNCKGYPVYIGTSMNIFDDNAKKESNLKLKKMPDDIYIAYCGTLGKSYDLKCVIDAIKIVNNKHVYLIVMGDGPQKSEFENYAISQKINSKFLGRIPYDEMCATLVKCDIAINPIVGLSVASIINKHADYAASGLPVLNTQNSKEYIQLVNEYNMGLNSETGNSHDLAKNIKTLVSNEEMRKYMGKNARLCAEKKFNRDNTYKLIIEEINGDRK